MVAGSEGLITGILVTLLLWAVFASNVLRDSAVNTAHSLETSLAIEPAFLPTLVGIAAGSIVFGVVALIAVLRRQLRRQRGKVLGR